MALSKTRRVLVGGAEYAWVGAVPASTLDWEIDMVTVAIQLATGKGQRLIANAPALVEGAARTVTPELVQRAIAVGLARGWVPGSNRPDLVIEIALDAESPDTVSAQPRSA